MSIIGPALSWMFERSPPSGNPFVADARTPALPVPKTGTSLKTATTDTDTASPPVLALPAPSVPRQDLRNISPRQFADLTYEMYLDGSLEWEEYRMVGFPSELDPRFDETIGALTGEKAEPDRPRDMLGQWEQRVDFERRHNQDSTIVARAQRILDALRCQELPPLDLSA